jgi:hypothetical protein
LSLLTLALDLLLHLADLGLGICLFLECLLGTLFVILDLAVYLLQLGSSLGFGITDVCGGAI